MKKTSVNYWPTYSLLGVFLVMIGIFGYYIHEYNVNEERKIAQANVPVSEITDNKPEVKAEDAWKIIYPVTVPMIIGSVEVKASIAKSWPERITGLSGTPYLPEDVVKFFIFDSSGFHSIWMKDMNYPIDIIWVNEESKIVYIKKDASPDSYPESFTSEELAMYVIETTAGFAEKNQIKVGDSVILPKL